jgi:geranylgeranyl reductase family protein
MYDVIVVGAGVAGATCACHLARGGARVLLLEREKHPRYKCCGGGVTGRAAALFPGEVQAVSENTIYGARLSYGLHPHYRLQYAEPLFHLTSRENLDRYLTELAMEAGATMLEETAATGLNLGADSVTVTTSRGDHKAAYVVGADGARSVIAKSVGISPAAQGVGLEARLKSPSYQAETWAGCVGLDYNPHLPGGYGWAFPKRDYVAVGVGGPLNLRRLLKPYLARLISLFSLNNYETASLRGHLMPVRHADTPVSRGRILLAGDAGALIDHLTGEGMHSAMLSARLAARAVLSQDEADPASSYGVLLASELGPELEASRVFSRVIGWTPLPLFHFLGHSERTKRAVGELVRGQRSYVEIAKQHQPLSLALRLF